MLTEWLHKAVQAPTLLTCEFVNVTVSKRRAGVDPVDVERALREFSQQRIDLHPVSADAMASIAARYDLTSPMTPPTSGLPVP